MLEASRTDTFQLCRVLRAGCARARERYDQIDVASAAAKRRSNHAFDQKKVRLIASAIRRIGRPHSARQPGAVTERESDFD
jgi:hypothetical protein